MPESNDRQLEAYVQGKLSPPEARELAQAALENDELFDALTAHGVVERRLEDPSFRAALEKESGARVIGFPRRARAIAIGSIAAAVALAAVVYWRSASVPNSAAVLPPSLDLASKGPVLLAADLQARASTGAPAFRGADAESRVPQSTGTILSVEGREATINLGSLDGLAKNAEVEVSRGAATSQAIARLSITIVFRDRARGTVIGPAVRSGDQVRTTPATYFAAVLEEMNAFASGGNTQKARELGKAALASDAASSGPARQVWERMAALDYQAGDVGAAEKDYQSAIASFESNPAASGAERSATLNGLAVLLLLGREVEQAQALLNQAQGNAPGSAVTVNNLAVLAELRGDRARAEALYQDALREADPAARAAIEQNLVRVRK